MATAWGTLFPLTVGHMGSSPMFKTDITVGKSGYEVRNANWQDPLRKYNAAYSVRQYSDIDTLLTFFYAVKGREQSFLVKDYLDFEIPRTNIGTGNSSATAFQLIKKYTHGVIGTYTRTITKPKATEGVGGVRVWVNNVELSTSAFSFSSSTGVITLSAAPTTGHAVEASCDEFYVPCRFDTDELPMDLLVYFINSGANYGLVEVPEIPLIEVRGE